jgi:hypothetical protein
MSRVSKKMTSWQLFVVVMDLPTALEKDCVAYDKVCHFRADGDEMVEESEAASV